MCIAILNKQGKLSRETFTECWRNNPDGGGFSYHNGDGIVIVKDLYDVKRLYKSYSKHRDKYPSVPFSIHFRVATCGNIDYTNCHPFKTTDHSSLIHNGIINGLSDHTSEHSDTYRLNELLKTLPANWYNNDGVLHLLTEYIDYSKLVIIHAKGYRIVNEQAGTWDGGNWYSNGTYKPQPKATKYAYNSRYYVPQGCDFCQQDGKYLYYMPEYNAEVCHDCYNDLTNEPKYLYNE